MAVSPRDAEQLQQLLVADESLGHLRTKSRGDSITIFSGHGADQQKHARLTQLGPATWGLSLPRHTGRWERTPFVGSMDELVATLVRDFSFYLEQW